MKPQTPTHRRIYLLLAAAFILYLLLLPRFHIGAYNDDGAYVLAAQSLLKGKYVQLNMPQQPPFTLYPPGFPLLLAPFALLVGSKFALLKGVSLFLTLLSLFLLWKLTEGWLTANLRLCLVATYALNPITTLFSGLVMSEPFFICAFLGILLWARHHPEELTPKRAWLAGGLFGWALLIRTDGIALLPALAVYFMSRKHWKAGKIALPVAAILCGLFYLRNSLVSGASTVYQAGWGLMLGEINRRGWSFPLRHAYDVLTTLVFQNFLSPLISIPALPIFLSVFVVVTVAALAVWGARELVKQHPQDKAVFLTIGCFCALYLGVHLFWLGIEARYGMPLVPFILLALFKGVERLTVNRPGWRKKWGIALAVLGFSYLAQNAMAIRTAWFSKDPTYSPETYRWINQSLPPDSLTLVSGPAVVYLYTGRFMTLEAAARDAEHFRYELLRQNIRYVFFRPLDYYRSPLTGQDPNRVWAMRRLWTLQNPKLYRSVYRNAAERTEVFEVQPHPTFVSVYEQYLSALAAFDKADWDKGFAQLDRVLQRDPNLISAYNAYGVGSLLSGKKTDAALKKMRQGVALAPEHALLILNLAKLEQRAGEYGAKQRFLRARQVAEKTGEFPSVLRTLEQDGYR